MAPSLAVTPGVEYVPRCDDGILDESDVRAAIYEAYGSPDVVRVCDVPTPVPRDDEILLRVHATTVTAADWRIRSRNVPAGFGVVMRLLFGWSRPRQRILGTAAAGVIIEVGKAVTRFSRDQAVVVFVGARTGCHAQFVCVKQDAAIAPKPAGVSFEDAAALCFGGTTALYFLRAAKLKAGERVLINGAGGDVGSAAVQLAKHANAHVTGVCSTAKVEVVRALGADEVVDYTQQDVLRNGCRYDVIMDAVGTVPFARCKGSLEEAGRLLLVVAGLPQMLEAPWVGLTTRKRVIVGSATEHAEDLRELVSLCEHGHLRPLIGARFPLDEIVEAHHLVETGHKQGSVVITVHAG